MLDSITRGLGQPEYLHTLLNPLPIYGLAIALLGLVIGLFLRSRPAQVTSLCLVFLSAVAVWPVVYFGEHAYDQILTLTDDPGRAWLEEHSARAEKLAYVFYALAAVSAAAVFAPKKWPRTALPLTVATVVLALGSLGAGASIAYAGGKIRHREFRTSPPPERLSSPSRLSPGLRRELGRDVLFKFHDICGEFADALSGFLGRHGVVIEQIAK